jgi:hydrogenase maturation protease
MVNCESTFRTLLEDFQLQIEHAMDMKDRRLVLFIDAGMDTPVPYSFYRAQANDEPVLYSHALAPEALLKVYTQFYQDAPPDVFILCICGERFELGEALSSPALERLAQALEFGKKLLQEPETCSWDDHLSHSDSLI